MNQAKFKQTEIGKIPEDWEVVTIPNVAANFDNKRKPLSSAERSKMRGKYPYYGAAGIIDYVNDFIYEGDYLLIAEDGTVTYDGSKPMLQLPHGKFWVSNHAHVLQCNSYEDTQFLYYQLKNTPIISFITGAVQPKLNQENLNRIKFLWIYNDSERHNVTKILSDLDTKIELNQQTNRVLEAIGQALFKHWFVDFEFPNENGKPYKLSGGEMVDSELGEIPKGWEVKKLRDLFRFIKGKKPKEVSEELQDGFLLQILIETLDSKAPLFANSEKMIITTEKDPIMVMDGASSGRIEIGFIGILGSTLALLKINNENLGNLLYYFLKNKVEDIKQNTTGTSIPHADKNKIYGYEITIPEDEIILDKFQEETSIILNKIISNNKQIQSLQKIRNLLLPKLMFGEVRVC